MPITRQNAGQFSFSVTRRLLEFFDDNRIRTTDRPSVHRWKLGDEVAAATAARFKSHTMLLLGNHVLQVDAFSYSFSPLNPLVPIGRYCSIAPNVSAVGLHHAIHLVGSSELFYRRDGFFADTMPDDWSFYPNPQKDVPSVGNDVWIGQNVMIQRGVTIGDGAVVGAGSLVIKDVAPYEIVGGVPAKRLRMRFEPDVVAALLELRWWQYFVPSLPPLPWERPAEFVAEMRQLIESDKVKPFQSDLGSVRDVVAMTD